MKHTDVTAAGLETPIVTNIAWVGGNEFSLC